MFGFSTTSNKAILWQNFVPFASLILVNKEAMKPLKIIFVLIVSFDSSFEETMICKALLYKFLIRHLRFLSKRPFFLLGIQTVWTLDWKKASNVWTKFYEFQPFCRNLQQGNWDFCPKALTRKSNSLNFRLEKASNFWDKILWIPTIVQWRAWWNEFNHITTAIN